MHGNKGKKLSQKHKRQIGAAAKINSVKHGFYGTRFYCIFYKMHYRCQINHPKRKYYFEKGISVCKRWHKFMNFLADMYMGYLAHCLEYGEKETTLDRIKNQIGYSKKNCRWATYSVQNKNRTRI